MKIENLFIFINNEIVKDAIIREEDEVRINAKIVGGTER